MNGKTNQNNRLHSNRATLELSPDLASASLKTTNESTTEEVVFCSQRNK